MSHRLPRAHIRHANRAGGFGNGLGLSFPPIGNPNQRPTSTTTDPASTSLSSSLPSPPLAPSTPLSSSPPSSTSSAPPSSAPPSSTSAPPTSTTHLSSPPVSPTSTYTGSALHNNLTKYVTQTNTQSAFIGAASATNSVVPTSNALVAPVLGGVAGGVVGLAVLVFLVTFCLRRRRKDDEAINFDPGVFRRSAMLLPEPPTHQDTVNRGYNPPPPPPMVETRPMYMTHHPNYDLSPGVVTPNSGNPLVFEAPFSPISPGVTSPVSAYDHAASGAPPVLTRNVSASSTSSAHGPAQHPTLPVTRSSSLHAQNEYMDMERTSVTPFQAAQYAEISKQLNTEVPKGLNTPAVDEFVANKMDIIQDPFEVVDVDANVSKGETDESDGAFPKVQDLSFPAPPSPVATTASRYRVESMPPTLPEIVVQPRVSVFSESADNSGRSSPSVPGFPSGQTVFMKSPFADSPVGSRFPVTPSPLASSFIISTPPAGKTGFPAEPAPVAQPRADPKQRQSVYTVYDPEDAYGGI